MNRVAQRLILASREHQVVADGRTYTVRRMGDLALARLREQHRTDASGFVAALVTASVVGWQMDEASLYPGGGDSQVEFDPELFALWLEDQPQTFADLSDAILEVIASHRERRAESEKN